MHSEYNDIWLAIVEADLSNATKHVGMELNKLADRENGQVNLSMDLFLTICGGANEQAAKRHLARLKKAGLIHFSTKNEGDVNVFITFLNWVVIAEEESDPQISQISQIEEDAGASHFPKCDAPHDERISGSDGTEDARHLLGATHQVAPYDGPDRVAILSAQVEMLQVQVGQMQQTIGLLCQHFGVEVNGGEPLVGFGALAQDSAPDLARGRAEIGALMAPNAPDLARPRAEIGAKSDDFRREEAQQTNVCLFVNNSSIPEDLNKQTNPVTENAPNPARESADALHFPKCVAPRDEETNESDGAQDARHRPGATHQSDASPSGIPLDEQEQTFKLLTDPEIGVSHWEARKLAQSRSFDYVRCQVFAWQKEMADGSVRGTGALVNRIRCNFGASEPSKAQQESDLYQRHRTPFEVEAEEKVKEELRARMEARDKALSQPQPQSQPIPLEPVDPAIWQQTLVLLKKDFRGSSIFDRFVAPTRLLGVHEGVYVISVIDQEMMSQTAKMRGTLRRHLGIVLGENVPIRLEITRMSRERGIFRAGEFVGTLDQVYGSGWRTG